MWQTLGTVILCYNKLEDKKKSASRRVFTGILTKCKKLKNEPCLHNKEL